MPKEYLVLIKEIKVSHGIDFIIEADVDAKYSLIIHLSIISGEFPLIKKIILKPYVEAYSLSEDITIEEKEIVLTDGIEYLPKEKIIYLKTADRLLDINTENLKEYFRVIASLIEEGKVKLPYNKQVITPLIQLLIDSLRKLAKEYEIKTIPS